MVIWQLLPSAISLVPEVPLLPLCEDVLVELSKEQGHVLQDT